MKGQISGFETSTCGYKSFSWSYKTSVLFNMLNIRFNNYFRARGLCFERIQNTLTSELSIFSYTSNYLLNNSSFNFYKMIFRDQYIYIEL